MNKNKNKTYFSAIELNKILLFLIIAATAGIVGYALSAGEHRILDVIFTVSLLIFGIKPLASTKIKENLFSILLLGIASSFFVYKLNFSKIRVVVPEMLVIIILFSVLIAIFNRRLILRFQKAEILVIIFCSLYVLGGFLTSLYYKINPDYWLNSCFIPFIILLLTFSLMSSLNQMNKSLFIACLSMYGFLAFTVFTFLIGYGEQIPHVKAVGTLSAEVDLGKVTYVVWGNWLGASAAMIFPSFYINFLIKKGIRNRIFYTVGVILSIYLAYRSGTRGGILGILVGAILVSGLGIVKLSRPLTIFSRLTAWSLVALIVILLLSPEFTIHPAVERRFQVLYMQGIEVPNISKRIELVTDAYTNLLKNPLGIGFSTLWENYRIDEAIFFSWSANGVGLLGVIGFWGFCIILTIYFIKGVLFSKNLSVIYFSIIGISTFASTFLSAISSDQILLEPQTVMCFWFIMGCIFKTIVLFTPTGESHGLSAWINAPSFDRE